MGGQYGSGIFAAASIFWVMLKIEQNTLAGYEKGVIYTACAKIPKGQLITEENYENYFKIKELDKSAIPESALTNPEQAANLTAVFDIDKGLLLTEGMFEKAEEIQGEMEQPVIAGVKADDLHQIAGGILRRGDRIHIYSVRETGETVCVWKNAFVEQAFDSAGNTIKSGDTSTAAQRVNIYLEEGRVEDFYAELSAGSLRAVKVCP